ncbi:hypothetical protein S2091_1462 [Solimicrobium silvestre]|uniref:Uncharacterized protein n=2 Tax=Solimicrobium silvestre TaxID=2099400 RepID=A0A2S9H1N4_9BURK|nr:hypothetical protein S2091_1462 [Solimicrobium silvestre]
MLPIVIQEITQAAPVSRSKASSLITAPTVSPSVLNTLNIPASISMRHFCEAKFSNICNTCRDSGQAAQTMANHLATLLIHAGEVTAGNNAKFEVVGNLTNHLLGNLTRDDLTKAQSAANQIKARFHSDIDSQGSTQLDRTLNMLDLPYHKATHESGRMGHAREMHSDVRHFFGNNPYQDLANTLAYCHDHVQIKDDHGMGVGNSLHWGLNEIATAAALATLASESGVDAAGQEALLKVAGAVIPAGTAFNFMPNVGGDGKPGLGTIIEGMLRGKTLPANLSESGREIIAMAYTLAICDTQRNNLAGLARPTDDVIFKNASAVHRLLSNCAEKEPESFGTTFFDNGKLSEAGLALCSKLTSTVEVFEEFPHHTFSTPNLENGKPNNPLSRTFDPGSMTTEERDNAILQLIRNNGSFGSANVARDIESFSGEFSHPVLDHIKQKTILENPKTAFTDAYIKFADELKFQCEAGKMRMDEVLDQIKAMGGSVQRRNQFRPM